MEAYRPSLLLVEHLESDRGQGREVGPFDAVHDAAPSPRRYVIVPYAAGTRQVIGAVLTTTVPAGWYTHPPIRS